MAWVSFGPVKAENTQVVSRATKEVALTQRNLVIATGMMTSNVGQPVGYEVFCLRALLVVVTCL